MTKIIRLIHHCNISLKFLILYIYIYIYIYLIGQQEMH